MMTIGASMITYFPKKALRLSSILAHLYAQFRVCNQAGQIYS